MSSSGPVHDLVAIRARLHQDREWCVYALGDLDPRRRHHCDWFARGPSIALVYREFDVPILFAAGTPDVLDVVPELDSCLLQIPESFRSAVERRFAIEWLRPMQRMAIAADGLVWPNLPVAVDPLDASHEDEIRALYTDGRATHEEPDFFVRSQLEDGTFFGVRQQQRLVAVGGTHLYSPDERVGAIGNVYTHRAHRGRGYASAITARVVQELAARETETIALNVKAENAPAIRIYERLGFRVHRSFYDGRAARQRGARGTRRRQ